MPIHEIMDQTGHTTIKFDAANTVELSEAMERFSDLTSKGYRAATRKVGEHDYTLVKDFDPTVDETLFIPQMKGG